MHKYEIILYWSNEDHAFIADVPCMANADSQDDALQNVNDAMQLWIGTARDLRGPTPQPKGERLILACLHTAIGTVSPAPGR